MWTYGINYKGLYRHETIIIILVGVLEDIGNVFPGIVSFPGLMRCAESPVYLKPYPVDSRLISYL